ncbi:kinesin family member 20/23 [Pseudohyphozyma bogoriensis]|nr:kinesin family member 20/23 [Pseudohyphozyma bogoriensis]
MASRPTRASTARASSISAAASAAPTTRVTRSRTPSIVVEPPAPAAATTRRWGEKKASETTTASKKPLWNSSRINSPIPERTVPTKTGSGSALGRPATTAGGARTEAPRSGTTTPVGSRRGSEAVGPVGGAGDFEKRKVEGYDPVKEPIQAYLRIRPPPTPADEIKGSYLEIVSDSEVLMIPPAPTDLYKFTSIHSPSTTQSQFFEATTLPLVKDFLGGQNCLLFAYGTTGSGKTWTVQGGSQGGEDAGVLPRVLDVVWRSLEGKDVMGTRDEQGSKQTGSNKSKTGLRNVTPSANDASIPIIPVSDAYHYHLSISYAEIYNEKIYDLLESPLPQPSVSTSSTASTSGGLFGKAFAAVKGFRTVQRNALSLKADKPAPGASSASGNGNKYVAGMREVKVASADEARQILAQGQQNRRVYSTLANRASSRSHSVFTIKVVKTPKSGYSGEELTTRFSIVDLAGSERVVNSGTSGERLKEAGNINKSLMVLGQCMEVLRKNQERKDQKKAPAMVPFNHSKLTMLFQSFFVGDGKAVMIVNVNPYETGFDENSHVMKFSAVAKGVKTVTEKKVEIEERVEPEKERRVVRVSMVEGGEEEDVIYEEEDAEEEDGEEDEFVNALLEELAAMRVALYESQMQAAIVESQTRTKVVREYEEKLGDMERHYEERMREEAIEAENKFNAKLDILKMMDEERQGDGRGFDDSDEEAEEEEEEESEISRDVSMGSQEGDESGEEEEEVASFLLREGSASVDYDEDDSPAALAHIRGHVRSASASTSAGLESPLPAKPSAMLAEGGEGEDEENDTEVPLAGSSFEMSEEDSRSDAGFGEKLEALVPVKRVGGAKAKTAAKPKLSTDSVSSYSEEVMDLNKSVIIRKDTKSTKPKRKLGGLKVKDGDALDTITDQLLPAGLVKSGSGRSISSNRSSHPR